MIAEMLTDFSKIYFLYLWGVDESGWSDLPGWKLFADNDLWRWILAIFW